MKIRNGFVSNSSSSSFIVAVAKIVDEGKFNSWIGTLGLDKYNYKVFKLGDIISGYDIDRKGDEVTVESFETNVKLNTKGMSEDDLILAVNIINDEGDCGRFSGLDEFGEYGGEIDYDIDLDYFDDDQYELYIGLVEENGLSNVQKKYGAGRNG